MSYAKFERDLKKGQIYERLATEYFEYKTVFFPEGKCSEYDFILDKGTEEELKIEVKSDTTASRTGNFAIEYKCRGKKSGILKTEADFYIYFINYKTHDDCYKIPVSNLKRLCKEHGRKVSGGDDNASRMYLVKKEIFSDYLITKKYSPPYTPVLTENKKHKMPSYTDKLLKALEHLDNYKEIKQIVNDFRAEEAKKYEDEKAKQPKDVIPFGKYKGKTVGEVVKFDKKYLQWVLIQPWFSKFKDLKEIVCLELK